MLSPCVGICTYIDGKCVGCHRTLKEIGDWPYYTDQERKQIMERLDNETNFD